MPDLADPATITLADDLARSALDFRAALEAIAREADVGAGISVLLLELAQISLAGARLGAQRDFTAPSEYQPDVPEPDLDGLRMRLAEVLGDLDTYSFVFDPYDPEVVDSQLSDDLTSIAADLDNGLRHFRNGDLREALWWWQFSYVSSWGNLAGAALNALWSVVSHDRLDSEISADEDQVAAADEMLKGTDGSGR